MDVREVPVHRRAADRELAGDGGGRHAPEQEHRHLALATGQRLVGRGVDGAGGRRLDEQVPVEVVEVRLDAPQDLDLEGGEAAVRCAVQGPIGS